MSKNGKTKTKFNPRGAGRPAKPTSDEAEFSKADPSRQENAPPPPPDAAQEIKAEAKRLRSIKITPEIAADLGQQIAAAEAIPYAVVARAKDDPRWALMPEEIDVLAKVWGTAIYVYADEIAGWLPLVMLAVVNAAPVASRMMMEPATKSNMGAPLK